MADEIVTAEEEAVTQTEEVFCYIGPSLKSVAQSIQNGSIFNEPKEDLCRRFLPLIERIPAIADLIVAPEEILPAKNEIRDGEGAYYHTYRDVLKAARDAGMI